MKKLKINEKGIVLISSLVLFFSLLLMALLFYRERLFADCSYYAVNIIQWERFRFDHHRFILIFAECLPLFAVKLGLSLSTVLKLYSIGHVLFFLILFLILFFGIKNQMAAFSVLLIHTTNTVFLYFTPMVEIWYGAGLSVMFYALLEKGAKSKLSLALVVASEITILFSHPENFILVFTYLILFLEKEKKISKTQILLWAVFAVSLLTKALSFSSYEAEKVNHALDIESSEDTWHMLDTEYLFVLIEMLFKNYTLVLLLFSLSIFSLIKSKKWLRLVIYFCCFLGTIALINSVTTANLYDWYFEAMYLPMVCMAIVFFLNETLINWASQQQKIALVCISFIAAFSILCQLQTIPTYTARLNQLQNSIHKLDALGGSKFIVSPEQLGLSKEDMTWSIPMETLLLSAERGKEKTVSIGTPEDIAFEDVQKIEKDSSLFMLRRWDLIKNQELNPKYFEIKKDAYKQVKI
jgi:hypothetical protein